MTNLGSDIGTILGLLVDGLRYALASVFGDTTIGGGIARAALITLVVAWVAAVAGGR